LSLSIVAAICRRARQRKVDGTLFAYGCVMNRNAKEIPMHLRPLLSPLTRKHDTDVAPAARANPGSSLRRVLVAFALCLAGLSSISCGSDAKSEADCHGDVGKDCPATYDDALTFTLTCQSHERISAGHCTADGPLTLNRNWGTHQSNCFYDSSSRKLIGANLVNDSMSYCNGTSGSMSSGTVPVPYPYYCLVSGAERTMDCQASQP
jgi:hypothetical protein